VTLERTGKRTDHDDHGDPTDDNKAPVAHRPRTDPIEHRPFAPAGVMPALRKGVHLYSAVGPDGKLAASTVAGWSRRSS
jgi:hypothetical protein